MRTVEMGAVSSLLTACYDAVLEVDETLTLTEHSRQLATMLLHSAPINGTGLKGRCLLEFFPWDDQERIKQQFRRSILSESTSVTALNADMLDSDQTRVKVELFHAQFKNLADQRCFLVGLRELQMDEVVPVTERPERPEWGNGPSACFAAFEVPSFEILVLSEKMEVLCQHVLGKIPESILELASLPSQHAFCDQLQLLTNRLLQVDAQSTEQTFRFNLLGTGDVTASFTAEHDAILDTHVAVLTFGLSQPEVVLTEANVRSLGSPNATRTVFGRRSRNSRGSRSSGHSGLRSASGSIRTLHRTIPL
ncbi:Uncharacterized protein SCF082_LOCUS6345 [Durusdinium trenchii]|uniref:Uncharacterized protein n=1 Tax=Durusdinium trenchii TaxID=1381693 RepID=A0ABP0IC12_9DINO